MAIENFCLLHYNINIGELAPLGRLIFILTRVQKGQYRGINISFDMDAQFHSHLKEIDENNILFITVIGNTYI